uniref:Secreted protein n=1 Tax=Macrostomum lignano TaxID=282301 RepID=A0A1I8FG76_9PLAT
WPGGCPQWRWWCTMRRARQKRSRSTWRTWRQRRVPSAAAPVSLTASAAGATPSWQPTSSDCRPRTGAANSSSCSTSTAPLCISCKPPVSLLTVGARTSDLRRWPALFKREAWKKRTKRTVEPLNSGRSHTCLS